MLHLIDLLHEQLHLEAPLGRIALTGLLEECGDVCLAATAEHGPKVAYQWLVEEDSTFLFAIISKYLEELRPDIFKVGSHHRLTIRSQLLLQGDFVRVYHQQEG